MESGQEDEIGALKAIFCKEGELETKKDMPASEVNESHLSEVPGLLLMNYSAENYVCLINLITQPPSQDGHYITIYFKFKHLTDERLFKYGDISVTALLPTSYPHNDLPVITVKCTFLPVNSLHTLTGKILERANSLLGEAMLMDLFLYAQELLEEETEKYLSTQLVLADNILPFENVYGCCSDVKPSIQASINKTKTIIYDPQETVTSETAVLDTLHDKSPDSPEQLSHKLRSSNDSKTVTCVLQLDHMRSKQRYIKLIKKWILELGLTGRLCFCQKIILLVLEGNSPAVKEYIIKNRTTNVDVDSKGRSCKERMLKVLCEVPCDANTKFQDFAVLELQTPSELQDLFNSSSMGDMYKEYVIGQLGLTHSKSTVQRD